MSRIRMSSFLRGLPARTSSARTNRIPRKFTCAPGSRLKRHGVHAGDFGSISPAPPSPPGFLRERFGLVGMRPSESFDTRTCSLTRGLYSSCRSQWVQTRSMGSCGWTSA